MQKTLLAALLAAAPAAQAAPLRVMATFPELADVAREVGGQFVKVEAIARGSEDPHQIVMKPSFAVKLNRADAVVFNGLTLEHSFLPALLETAANPRMRSDTMQTCLGPGCVDCSRGVRVLEKPADLSRSQGELHPAGNPHYDLDPENGLVVAKDLEEAFARLDPPHAADYAANRKAFAAKLEAKVAQWRKLAAPLKGLKAVSFHQDIAYLAQFTGLDFIDTVEVKPGVPPTPPHMVKLVGEMKEQGVKLIVREQQYAPQESDWLAGQTGAKVAVIGVMAGAFPGADTFIAFEERNLKALLAAAGK